MNLNVSKNTFEKYLVKMGYNLKIKHYDDFIKVLRDKAFRDALESITVDNLQRIFPNYETMSIMSLIDASNINSISQGYLKILIDEGFFSIFFKEKKIPTFSKKNQMDAYVLNLVNNLVFDVSVTNHSILSFEYWIPEYSDLFRKKTSSRHISAFKCLNLNLIELDEIEKSSLDKFMNDHLKKAILFSFSGMEEHIENYLYESHYSFYSKKRLIEKINQKLFKENILNDTIYGYHFTFNREDNVFKIKDKNISFHLKDIPL